MAGYGLRLDMEVVAECTLKIFVEGKFPRNGFVKEAQKKGRTLMEVEEEGKLSNKKLSTYEA